MTTPESGTPTSFDDADRAVSVPEQKLQSSKVHFSFISLKLMMLNFLISRLNFRSGLICVVTSEKLRSHHFVYFSQIHHHFKKSLELCCSFADRIFVLQGC